MRLRIIIALYVLCFAAPRASAHFLFVVPDADRKGAQVFLSEELTPDGDVNAALVSSAKLCAAGQSDTPLPLQPGKEAYRVDLPAARVIYGTADIGTRARKDADAYLLIYHPKTILGDAFAPDTTLGTARAPAELEPRGAPGALKLRFLVSGKPAARADVTVICPDGKQQKVATDANGETPAFAQAGRYGAWTKSIDPTRGQRDGKPFAEIRHYATLVCDVPAPSATKVTPALPEATSSFGAAVCDNFLYVYGGHIARTHSYSTTAVSGRFHRRALNDPSAAWEDLPAGPALQGMNLATLNGKVYRVGGMQPRNAPGTPADNYSVADCARFDPATNRWEPLPSLPEPRSSHDVVALDGKLYAAGGWNMRGRAAGNAWLDSMLVLDPAAPAPRWQSLPQPFSRRALIAAAHAGKLYAIGGFTDESEPQLRVDVYDPAANAWTRGPDLPGPARNGFAPAACSLDNALYVSVGDGSLCRLTDNAWTKVATNTPRIVHRLAPFASQIFIVGGAIKGDNLDLIEAFTPPADRPR